jgi:hypothetical protein
VNLVETYIRAAIVQGLAVTSLERLGFKTEARLLKIQSNQLIKLVNKAIAEMPKIEPFDVVYSVLSGGAMSPAHREKRQQRGKYLQRIGQAEKVMLKTLRKSFDSLYKTHDDWTRRQQLQATSRMMKAMMEKPKEKAQSILAAASYANPPETKK